MPSAFIRSGHSYPAVPLARQLEHQRAVLLNPLVLKKNLRKFRAPTVDRDRPVSRRSEPSSRTTFIGEQPNPWKLLHLQDVMSRHRFNSTVSCGLDYIFILPPRLGDRITILWLKRGRSRRVSFRVGSNRACENSLLSDQSLRGRSSSCIESMVKPAGRSGAKAFRHCWN